MPTIKIGAEGVDVSKDLERMARDVQPTIDRVVRAQVPAIVQEVQRAARSLNISAVSGGKRVRKKKTASTSGGLRNRIALAVTARFDAHRAVIFVESSKMPSGKEGLPAATARQSWRHPVFGNREVWAEQRGRSGWFTRAVRTQANRTIPAEIQKAMERLIKK